MSEQFTGNAESSKVERFRWQDDFSVGVTQMDNDHKKLIGLLNRCIDVVNTDESDIDEIDRILDEMMKYANHHFHREEALMKDNGYPDLVDHQYEHQQFVIYVEQTIASYETGELTARDLLKFLKDWLSHHILEMDRDYVPYCSE